MSDTLNQASLVRDYGPWVGLTLLALRSFYIDFIKPKLQNNQQTESEISKLAMNVVKNAVEQLPKIVDSVNNLKQETANGINDLKQNDSKFLAYLASYYDALQGSIRANAGIKEDHDKQLSEILSKVQETQTEIKQAITQRGP